MSILNVLRIVAAGAVVGAAIHFGAKALAKRHSDKERAAVDKAAEEKLPEITAKLHKIEFVIVEGKVKSEDYVNYVRTSLAIIEPIAQSTQGKELLRTLRRNICDHYEALIIDVLTYTNTCAYVRQVA